MLLRRIALKLLLPIASSCAGIVRTDKERLIGFFVRINNKLAMKEIKQKPDRILLLMPHCLQFSDCEYRVTGKEIRCKMCGKCEIKDLMEISLKYDVKLSVATGGTMARNIVKSFQPDVIIATACERDLISGLQDTLSVPVIGVLNERPFGPCVDTRVNLHEITRLLEFFRGLNNEKKA